MASLIPVIANDARNTGFQHLAGDKKAVSRTVNKWGNYAKNPGKSMWGSFKSIFGFGIYVVPVAKRKTRAKPKPRGRPRKKK